MYLRYIKLTFTNLILTLYGNFFFWASVATGGPVGRATAHGETQAITGRGGELEGCNNCTENSLTAGGMGGGGGGGSGVIVGAATVDFRCD